MDEHTSELVLDRYFSLPPAVVWDALVDEVLVEGWLGRAHIDPRVGGHYDIEWRGPVELATTIGRIRRLRPQRVLALSTSNIGALEFQLRPEGEGSDGGTTLRTALTSSTHPRFAPTVAAYWLTNLDQLENLLRGRPVDWRNWQRDWGATWEAHFAAAGGRARSS